MKPKNPNTQPSVDVLVQGQDLDLEALQHNYHQLALSYLSGIRSQLGVPAEAAFGYARPSLPDRYDRSRQLRMTSEAADHCQVEIEVQAETFDTYILSTDGLVTADGQPAAAEAYSYVKDALFALSIRSYEESAHL